MKIIMILTNSFDPDVRVYKEAKYLVAKGLDVEIVCWDRKGKESNYPENEMVDGIIITRFREHSIPGTGLKQLPAFFRFAKRVKKYLKIQDYDYLHCHDLDGRIVGKKSNVKKKPIIFDMHEFYEKGNSIVKFVFRKMVMRLIDKSKYALYENDVYIRPPYCKYNNKLFSLKNYPDKDMVQALPKTKSGVFRICYHGAIRNQIPYFQALFIAASRLGERVRVDINGGGIDYDELPSLRPIRVLLIVSVHRPEEDSGWSLPSCRRI